MSNEIEQETVAVADEGALALRAALASESLEYALGRCLEEYALAMDGARRAADHAGLGAADRRAFLANIESGERTRLLADARDRRNQATYQANRYLVEWRRTVGARQRSLPEARHQFEDSPFEDR